MPQSLPAEATIAHASVAASASAYESTPASDAGDALLFRKIAWRIVPFLFLCYVVSFLDRINIGFAQLQMKHDLGFSDAMYGLGAAVFYVGYVFCEVTKNIPNIPTNVPIHHAPPRARSSLLPLAARSEGLAVCV